MDNQPTFQPIATVIDASEWSELFKLPRSLRSTTSTSVGDWAVAGRPGSSYP